MKTCPVICRRAPLWGVQAVFLATVLLHGAPAAARPLPKAEPPPKMRECPEVGEGYVRLPDSASCVKIGGLVRVEAVKRGGSR